MRFLILVVLLEVVALASPLFSVVDNSLSRWPELEVIPDSSHLIVYSISKSSFDTLPFSFSDFKNYDGCMIVLYKNSDEASWNFVVQDWQNNGKNFLLDGGLSIKYFFQEAPYLTRTSSGTFCTDGLDSVLVGGAAMTLPSNDQNIFNFAPNPFNAGSVFNIFNRKKFVSNARLTLFSSNGRRIKQIMFKVYPGKNTLKLNFQDLPSGVYVATMSLNDKLFRKKVTLLK